MQKFDPADLGRQMGDGPKFGTKFNKMSDQSQLQETDKLSDIFPNFRKKNNMIFHENRLPSDDFHEISCRTWYF